MVLPITFRDTIAKIVPRWLSGYWGSRLLYSVSVHLDVLTDATVAAVKMRMPGLYSYEMLGKTGLDRRINRTPNETDDYYAQRLTVWRQSNKRRGNPFALMEQVQAAMAPVSVRLAVVNQRGHRLELSAAGVPSVIGATSWDWDGDDAAWSRVWLLVYDSTFRSDGTWGDAGTWGDSPTGTFGSYATIEEVNRVRTVANDWGAAHAVVANIVIVIDVTAWNAAQPNGSWGRFHGRNPNVVYWDGTATT